PEPSDRHATRNRVRREVPVDERARADDTVVADLDPLRHYGLAADVARAADRHGRMFVRRTSSGDSPLHGVVAVDLHTGTDRAVVPDRQPAGAVEKHQRTDPGVPPDRHLAED